MCEFIQKVWPSIISFLDSFLQRLDPSLFQSIIMGILAIFIPFAIVFLTDILNSKNKEISEFEKMVLSDEILGVKKVFWLSIFGIVFFSFFSGTNTPTPYKILTIFVVIILIVLFLIPFTKILRFSEGQKAEFKFSFLKKLKISRYSIFNNTSKSKKILNSWQAVWSEKLNNDERIYTKMFISHIDNVIKHNKLKLSIKLANIYTNNIDKRNIISISHDILPKVLEWDKILWGEQQRLQKTFENSIRIQNLFSQKYFPTFKELISKFYKTISPEIESIWQLNYFRNNFFQDLIKIILKDNNSPYQLFNSFKQYIEEVKNESKKHKSNKEKYDNYIRSLFSIFCDTLFNEIDNSPSNFDIWKHYFPSEWKIISTNKDSKITHLIFNNFLHWSRNRILNTNDDEKIDKNLVKVIHGIFPDIDPSLFTTFLILYFSNELIYTLEKDPNFYILGPILELSGSIEESREERDHKIREAMEEKIETQKKETIQIILSFFNSWKEISIFKKDLNEDELNNWDIYSENQKENIYKKVITNKLKKILSDIQKPEVQEIYQNSDIANRRKENIIELINLLLTEIQNNKQHK